MLKSLAEFTVVLVFSNKIIHVYVIGDANAVYSELKQTVEQELSQNKNGTILQTLLKSIENKKEELKKDPFYGIRIPKKLIPQEYINKS